MRFILWPLFLYVVVIATVGAQQPQQKMSLESRIPDIVNRLENGDLRSRKSAFDDLMGTMSEDDSAHSPRNGTTVLNSFLARHPDHAEPVKLGLIHLLMKENYLFVEDKNPPDYTEDDSEHYAELIDSVASIEDERAIPALVDAMTTGGMAERGLLKYGDKALEPVLRELNNQNPIVRSAALGVGVTILKSKADSESKTRLTTLVESSLRDPDSILRGEAVMLVACLENRQQFVPILQRLAQNDPANLPLQADDPIDGGKQYPVRREARQALRDIQSNKSCTP